ncbi:c-factor [Nephila pilipes]|uniref:C-factor n=1 Tax=Nephila pilipes TaxID=299642 RepID=A0A8X6N4P3_NEPPI|nr:c-factor [Nephila pilipes]
MALESVLVTGANRGLGLEFVRQLVELPKPPRFVFATYRDKNTTQALGDVEKASKQTKIVLISMDIRKTDQIKAARKIVELMVGDRGLNLLINNAGALRWVGFSEITQEDLLFQYHSNAIGPVMVLKEMLPLLQKAAAHKRGGMKASRAAVLNISSMDGSIQLTEETSEKWLTVFGYRISKTALNMAMRVVALTVMEKGILVVNICPGWVRTDMGTEDADLEVTESISTILKTLSRLDESHHGAFLDRNGKNIQF